MLCSMYPLHCIYGIHIMDITKQKDMSNMAICIIIFFLVVIDGKPSLSHGTLVVVPLLPKGSPTNSPWAASVEDVDANQLKVQV